MKITKTPPPSKRQIILGIEYDSVSRRIVTAKDKQKKYLRRVRAMIMGYSTTRRLLEKLHGNLNYVADIEPFGRPILAHLT